MWIDCAKVQGNGGKNALYSCYTRAQDQLAYSIPSVLPFFLLPILFYLSFLPPSVSLLTSQFLVAFISEEFFFLFFFLASFLFLPHQFL